MKKISTALIVLTAAIASCGGENKESAAAAVSFCSDTTCISEPIIAENGKAKLQVVFNNCTIDSIHWTNNGAAAQQSIVFKEYIGKDIKVSKQKLKVVLNDEKYAWLIANDCATGRGYVIKMPFTKEGTLAKYKSALTGFDPKFKVEDGLVAYYDNTFIYVQDMTTQKVAKTLLSDVGVRNINFDEAHSVVDSVNITKTDLFAILNLDGKPTEKKATLEFK